MEKSESINKLAEALLCFQGKLISVKKDGVNPHFGKKYASLNAIIEAIRKPLTECGLAIIQLPKGENLLETILLHNSGEYISETYVMKPARNDPQGVGSVITYQRRYALGAILSLNTEEDDDAETATKAVLPKARFDNLVKKLKAEPDRAAELLTIARQNFTISEEQEKFLREWEDNLNNL